MRKRKSWLEVSEQRLRANFRTLAEVADAAGPGTGVLAVVKANAYGHGAALCAPILAAAGATWLGVTDASEGAMVREALSARTLSGAEEPRILVMCGPMPEDAGTIVAQRLTPVVWSVAQLDWLTPAVGASGPLPIHLEIDTGMSRQGIALHEPLERLLDQISTRPELRLDGVLTHFASAEISGSPLTVLQNARFESALDQIARRSLKPTWIHAGNSSSIDEFSSIPSLRQLASRYAAAPLVRSGLALYGYTLPLQGAISTLQARLHPVLTWKCRIAAIEDLSAGATIGYNGTYVAPEPMRVALLPVGYADGLRRELSSASSRCGGWVLVRGQRASIVGRISMNLTTVDITSIPDAAVDDEVVLLGDGVSASDHARLAGTIPYEILCGMRSEPQLAD